MPCLRKKAPDTFFALAVASAVLAQPTTRVAATVEALVTYPLYFHGREVVVRGTLDRRDGLTSLASLDPAFGRRVHVVTRNAQPDAGPVEARGDYWDLGRLQPDDPRLAGFDVQRVLDRVSEGRWPGQNQVFVLALTLAGPPAALPSAPSTTIRALALEPERYEGQKVTVTGRFRGVNLFGDAPQSPSRSRWDFVLQSADAAVWVTGLRPRGKGFDLDRNARVDTGRYLEVTGLVGRTAGLVWIDAEKIALGATQEPAAVVEIPVPKVGPPPEVTFSLPTPDDTDVERSIVVRIQFSRDMDKATFKERVRARYAAPGPEGASPDPPPLTIAYRDGTMVLEVRFSAPLERFRVVEIELLDGIAAFDGAPLKTPYVLRFTTGPQ
jgi:hypothetical protein